MNENMFLLACGLVSDSCNSLEEWSFVGIALPGETPYDFSTRLLCAGYGHVTTVPLWRLPQFSKAWQQFLERNQCTVGEGDL